MKQRTKAFGKHRQPPAVGGLSVLANVGNSFSSNIITSHTNRRTRKEEERSESGDTDENELQLGLGGLFLESQSALNHKSFKLSGKAIKRSRIKARRKEMISVHPPKLLRGQDRAHPSMTGGLFAFTQPEQSASIKPRNIKITKQKIAMAKPPLQQVGRYPTRSRVASGYDAEEEADKPSTPIRQQRRQKPETTKKRKPQLAPGLLSLFASQADAGKSPAHQTDDMDWLCSRLDQHCSIAQGSKKRSAAQPYLLDSLCKRIDQKATPAKLESTGGLLTKVNSDDNADDIKTEASTSQQDDCQNSAILDQSLHQSDDDDVPRSMKQSGGKTLENDADETSPKAVKLDGKCQNDTNAMADIVTQRRPVMDPPGYAYRTSSTVKAQHDKYEGSPTVLVQSKLSTSKPTLVEPFKDPTESENGVAVGSVSGTATKPTSVERFKDLTESENGLAVGSVSGTATKPMSVERSKDPTVSENGLAVGPGTGSSPTKDYGCVYAHQRLDISPIASPLLDIDDRSLGEVAVFGGEAIAESRSFELEQYPSTSTVKLNDCSLTIAKNDRQTKVMNQQVASAPSCERENDGQRKCTISEDCGLEAERSKTSGSEGSCSGVNRQAWMVGKSQPDAKDGGALHHSQQHGTNTFGCVYTKQRIDISPIASPLLDKELSVARSLGTCVVFGEEEANGDSQIFELYQNPSISMVWLKDYSLALAKDNSPSTDTNQQNASSCKCEIDGKRGGNSSEDSCSEVECSKTSDGYCSDAERKALMVVRSQPDTADGEILRRSQRHRKATDRLSIDLGGGCRHNKQKQKKLPIAGGSKVARAKRRTRRKAAVLPCSSENDNASAQNEQEQHSFEEVRATRRSKRSVVPTPLHMVDDAKRTENLIRRTRSRSTKQLSEDRTVPDGNSAEDDFLDDCSSNTEKEDSDVTLSIESHASDIKKQQTFRGGEIPSNCSNVSMDKNPSRRRQGLKIASKKLPALKKTFLREDNTEEWTGSQLNQLHRAYNQVDPTCPTFWQQISQLVDAKSPSECQAKWFSLAKTPALKGSKSHKRIDHEEDDIFDATPIRFAASVLPSRVLQERMQKAAKRQMAQMKPISSSQEIQRVEKTALPHVRHGFKTYLQEMRRDVNRAEKVKSKKLQHKKPVRHTNIADQDNHVNMRAKLTPGGTLDIKHQEDIDEWDEDMYDADEDDMEDNE